MSTDRAEVYFKRMFTCGEETVEQMNHLLPQLTSSASPITLAGLTELVNDRRKNHIWAVHDLHTGRIVGMAQLSVIDNIAGPAGGKKYGLIDNVVLDSSTRGMGLGRRLMEAIIDDAKACGLTHLDLTSKPAREAANGLYQSLGFELRATNPYRLKIR